MVKILSNLTIIIPCLNEGLIIENTISRISKWCIEQKLNYEIIIVNNNSTDNTEATVKKLLSPSVLLYNEIKKGKGYAVKLGLLKAKYNNVLILDADLSTDIDYLNINWLNGENKIIVGSRPLGNEKNTPILRKFYGKILNFLIRLLFPLDLMDTQCGFKFLTSSNLIELSKNIEFGGFLYDLNLILLCQKYNYKIIEIPVEYNYNKNSSISLISDPIYMFIDLIKIKNKF